MNIGGRLTILWWWSIRPWWFKRYDPPQYHCYRWRLSLGPLELRWWAKPMPRHNKRKERTG